MEYDNEGYLPEAMINYLARLGWSHGDDELFTREQLVQWFDTDHLTKSASQWDPKKLNWVNAHHISQMPRRGAGRARRPRASAKRGGNPEKAHRPARRPVALLKDRAETLEQLAEGAMLFCGPHARPRGIGRAASEPSPPARRWPISPARAKGTPSGPSDAHRPRLIKAVLADRGSENAAARRPPARGRDRPHPDPLGGRRAGLLGKEAVLARLSAI